VLRGMFGPKRDEVTDWETAQRGAVPHFALFTNIIRTIKSKADDMSGTCSTH
jgi:hypothetical protein